MSGTVLITGVAGFPGRYVARHFAREGWRLPDLAAPGFPLDTSHAI